MPRERAAFTLRFKNERVHAGLGLVARQRGVSMSQLAEEYIERELRTSAVALEAELTEMVTRLRELRGGWSDEEIEAAAEAEATSGEPEALRVQMITREELARLRDADPYEVAAAFARPVER